MTTVLHGIQCEWFQWVIVEWNHNGVCMLILLVTLIFDIADFYHDVPWTTTPMSLPPTPDSFASTPSSILMTPPSAMPTLMSLPTYQPAVPSPSYPLTPDSLVSPHFFYTERDKALVDILSFLQEPGQCVTSDYDHFNSFQPPLVSYDQHADISNGDEGKYFISDIYFMN